MAPAIVHDFLYWEQPCDKDEADAVMYVAMKQTGMSAFSANRIYDGIRTQLAVDAWERNKIARANGDPRFFTAEYSRRLASGNLDPNTTLAEIQSEAIKEKGVVTPMLPIEQIKLVCQAALRKFNAMRGR